MYHIGVVLFILFSSPSPSEHALYLSVVEISDMEEGMDITIKVFRDDMVDALRNHGDALQSTMDSLDDGEIRDYFSEYISYIRFRTNLSQCAKSLLREIHFLSVCSLIETLIR